jgi:hypothetical protein
MSSSQQFINSNNQSLLWKVINNTPQTIHFFEGAPPGEKERWFQQCMGQIYNQHVGQNISIRDLNKKAIDFMLQTLNKRFVANASATERLVATGPSANAPIEERQSINKPMIVSKPMTTTALSMNDQFARRQAEYDSMVKKEVPTHNFTENVKDEAILDLNSVVEAYKRNRTEDVGVVIPPPSASPTQKLNLRSNNELETVSIHVEELPKKGVQWGQNTEHEFDNNHSIIEGRIVNIEKGINELKSQMSEILSILKVIPYQKTP